MPAQWPGNSVTKAAEPDGSGGYRSAIEASAPGAPTFTTSATDTSITATITDAAGATSYESSVDGTTWVSGLTVSGLTAETAYTFRVRGINASGTGPSASVSETTAAASAAPSISSVTDNGSTLTITGSNFGAKTQAAPVIWDFGSDTRVNGTTVAAPAVGDIQPNPSMWGSYILSDTPDPADSQGQKVVNDTLRHNNIDRCWRAFGKGQVMDPQGYPATATAPDSKRAYLAYWLKPGNIYGVTTSLCSEAQVTGTPQYNATRQGGESCDVYDGATLIEEDSHVLNFVSSNNIVTFSEKSGAITVGSADYPGKTFIGRSSGAEIFIPLTSTVTSCGSVKHARMGNLNNYRGPNSFYTSYTNIGGTIGVQVYDETGAQILDPEFSTSVKAVIGQWRLFEQIVDISDPANGKVEIRSDGVKVGEITGIDVSAVTVDTPLYFTNIGMETPGCFPLPDCGFGMDWGEIYQDNSVCRVYASDGGIPELQRPISWSDTEIVVAKNQGAITGAMTISVANAAGQSSFVGVS